ncbi:MAG: chromosome segregation protein SMC, partial [Anaerotardibacter sp.]
MHLKSLNLKGFKSFADRTVMRFEPGLAAIVGPNGSGKSNISDAVLWVLGERNAKNLRGQSMEDVIFAGSSARKPVSVAEVELVLDNSDNTLPVEFNEVSIGRRMHRSGESEYLINGTVVRRMDVLDILHDSGLGTGTNSIISQGNLDAILSSKPEDRRALIEEAAGILKHKERKMKSERKLAQMDNHLLRVNDIVSEVERQLKPLERKAKRAIAYEQASGELAELKLKVAVDDLRLLQNKWDEILKSEETLNADLATARVNVETSEKTFDELQKQLDQRGVNESLVNSQYRGVHTINERLNSTTMLLQEKKRNAHAELERASNELALNQLRVAENQKELEKVEAQHEEISKTYTQAKEALESLESRHKEQVSQRNKLRKTVETLTATQRGYIHKIESAEEMLAALKNNLSEKEARASILSSHIADAENRLAKAKEATIEEEKKSAELQEKLTKAQSEEKTSRELLNKTLVARDEARKTVDKTRTEYVQTSSERNALEEMDRVSQTSNQALLWVLDNKKTADSLQELSHVIKVPPHLEMLVEAFLGEDINSFIVEDDKKAQELITSVLNAEVHGRVSLLPGAVKLAKREGAYPSLAESISCAEKYRATVDALFGSVYVFNTFNEAMDAYRSCKTVGYFVSTEGVVIDPSGKITFIKATEVQKEQSTLARRRHFDLLSQKEKELEQRYENAQHELERLEANLKTYQSEALRNTEAVALLRGQYNSSVSDLEKNKQTLSMLEKEYQSLVEEQKQNQEFLQKAQPDTDQLQEELEKYQALLAENKAEIAQLSEELSPLQREIVRLSEKLSDARLENARLSERFAYSQRMVQSRKQEIASVEVSDHRALEAKRLATGVLNRVEPLIRTLQAVSASVQVSIVKLQRLSAEEQEKARTLHQELSQATKASRTAHDTFDAINHKLSEVRIEKGRLEVQVEAAIKVIVTDCETPLETAFTLEELDNREEVVEEVGKLERRIKNMGTINPDAAKEYEEVKARFGYLNAQLQDMKLARQSLSRIVKIIDERMKDDFINTFNQVNQNFSDIFATLFPGGQAHLSLVDPDDLENTGVDVNAQPVGKRIKKMSLLSGGEKSMTALALLFAVYRIRQTPFYILDEV